MQWVEPVQRLGLGAMRDTLIVIPFAEIPQPNLIEVVQPDRSRNTVDEEGIGDGDGDDMRQIEFHEIRLAHHGTIGDVSNAYQQQEDPSYEVEQRAKQTMREDCRFFPPGNHWLTL